MEGWEMTTAERFKLLCDSFTPRPDDYPDSIPFYRAAFALRELWGAGFVDTYYHIWHQAACYSSDAPTDRYAIALATARKFLDAPIPKASAPCHNYDAEPTPPTEVDAKKEFCRQYRRAFPGKRVNSKHANELWAQTHDAAVKIVMDRYKSDLDDWFRREREHSERNARNQQVWMDTLHERANMDHAILALPN